MIELAGRRPKRTTIDPAALADGEIARQTGSRDRYFGLPDDVLTLIVQAMVDRLPEPDRSCVRMTVMSRLSYAEAGRLLGVDLGRAGAVDPRTVWRWARRGVDLLRVSLAESPWAADMLVDRVPPGVPSWEDTRPFDDAVSRQGGTPDVVRDRADVSDVGADRDVR